MHRVLLYVAQGVHDSAKSANINTVYITLFTKKKYYCAYTEITLYAEDRHLL